MFEKIILLIRVKVFLFLLHFHVLRTIKKNNQKLFLGLIKINGAFPAPLSDLANDIS